MATETRGQHFGRVAQDLGLVAGYQVLESLDRQRLFAQAGRGTGPISQHLCELGYLAEEQVPEVLREIDRRQRASAPAVKAPEMAGVARPRRFGEIALDLGLVERRDVEYALELQRVTRFWGREARPIGLLLVGMGALTLPQVDEVMEALTEERARCAAATQDTRSVAVPAENVGLVGPTRTACTASPA